MVFNPIIEYLDKPLVRFHRRIGNAWEGRGHNIHSLSFTVGLSALYVYGVGGLLPLVKSFHIPDLAKGLGVFSLMIPFGVPLTEDLENLETKSKDDVHDSGVVAVNLGKHFYRMVDRTLRLPAFLAGTSLVGKVVFDVFRYGWSSTDDGMYLRTGLGLLGLASSMYLKERDPKYLESGHERIKSMINKLATKAGDYIPRPFPSPRPNFQNLESILYLV